jgi:hypothetical protein
MTFDACNVELVRDFDISAYYEIAHEMVEGIRQPSVLILASGMNWPSVDHLLEYATLLSRQFTLSTR